MPTEDPGKQAGTGWLFFILIVVAVSFGPLVCKQATTQESQNVPVRAGLHRNDYSVYHDHFEEFHYNEFAHHAPPLEYHAVVIKNPDGIRNKNEFFPFDSTCFLRRGGIIKKLADAPVPEYYLVVYESTPPLPAGTDCPNGTVFYVNSQDLDAWDEYYRVRRGGDEEHPPEQSHEDERREREREAVRAILKEIGFQAKTN